MHRRISCSLDPVDAEKQAWLEPLFRLICVITVFPIKSTLSMCCRFTALMTAESEQSAVI
jgi:hypothetical protein